MNVFINVLFLSLYISVSFGADPNFISVNNGGKWGEWAPSVQYCPQDTVAVGFALKSESHHFAGDDTGLNGIALQCSRGDNITSTVGE